MRKYAIVKYDDVIDSDNAAWIAGLAIEMQRTGQGRGLAILDEVAPVIVFRGEDEIYVDGRMTAQSLVRRMVSE